MLNIQNLRNKKVGILGLGKTGLSVIRAIQQAGALLTCWDDDIEKRVNIGVEGVTVKDLKNRNILRELDLLIVSPGIPHLYPKPHEVVSLAYELNIKVDNDIGLFFSSHIQDEYETFSTPPKIIAITGSNGKSTATALAGHVFSKVFRDVEIGGNIGKPVLELSPLKEGSIRILELSSYQIELAKNLSPNFAAFINFSSDHVQRHGGLGGYFYGKARLFLENLTEKSVINIDTAEGLFLYQRLSSSDNKIIAITSNIDVKNYSWAVSLKGYFLTEWQKGRQVFSYDLRTLDNNLITLGESILVVYALARSYGMAPKSILSNCNGFMTLKHRNQTVDVIQGVAFINDSKATNVDATRHALKIYKNVHLILGGQAKENNFDKLQDSMENISRIYPIGEAASLIASSLAGNKLEQFNTLDKALERAISHSRKGDTILFSPACASFDQYLNFEERGNHFISLVEKYRKNLI
ncbi:UDP-N-acetylmuramoyl-L-alanine--D-glutamate ligase [Paracoccaceae bacterium]|nr:UDP-N-acetylmuramoyl-L-alanine--D-glutamate ligase [Paracoccaceae bacterium]